MKILIECHPTSFLCLVFVYLKPDYFSLGTINRIVLQDINW